VDYGKLQELYKQRSKKITETALALGKQKYKYNILTTSPNEFLVDLRNFYNFRSTQNNMLTGVHKIKATTSLQAGTNPSKSYYMTAGDFLFAEDFDLNVDQNMSIQYAKLVINEKQPM
jgi:hypothetical protein